MYRRDIVNLGFVKIRDLNSANNSFSCDFSSLTNSEQRFFLMSIINPIPTEWPSLIKASTNVTSANPTPITPTIKMASGSIVPILDIVSWSDPSNLPAAKANCAHRKTEIIKQVLKYRYWLGKGLHFGLSMHFRHKDQIDGSEKRNRQLAFEHQNSHVCEKRSNVYS